MQTQTHTDTPSSTQHKQQHQRQQHSDAITYTSNRTDARFRFLYKLDVEILHYIYIIYIYARECLMFVCLANAMRSFSCRLNRIASEFGEGAWFCKLLLLLLLLTTTKTMTTMQCYVLCVCVCARACLLKNWRSLMKQNKKASKQLTNATQRKSETHKHSNTSKQTSNQIIQ